MFENLFKSVPETNAAIEPILYTQLDDGTFQEQMDIIYPPGTRFYTKNAEGEFVYENIEIGQDQAVDSDPGIPKQITKEFMIETSMDFLQANGFVVIPVDQQPEVGADLSASTLRSQISALKDEITRLSKPGKPGDKNFESAILFEQLRSMVSSHMTSHSQVEAAVSVIEKLQALI